MKIIKDGSASGSACTPQELQAIHAFAKAQLTADEVYAFQEAQEGLQKTVEADNNMMNLAQKRAEELLRNYVNSLAKATGTEYQEEFHYIEEDETA